MLVSAIIPHFNRPEKLRRAVRSVMGQARPDGVSLELIVVDDASPAGCDLSFLDELADVRLIRHEANRGAAAARNTAIEAARGEFIAQLDSDDAWLPSFVASQLAFWEAQGGRSCEDALVVTGGSERLRKGQKRQVWTPRTPEGLTELVSGCPYNPGTTLFAPSAVFTKFGPYRPELRRLEDYEWLVRSSNLGGRLVCNPDTVAVVEASGTADLHVVRSAVEWLCRKDAFHPLLSKDRQRCSRAYLHLCLAAAARDAGAWPLVLTSLLRSLTLRPRWRAQMTVVATQTKSSTEASELAAPTSG